MEFPGSQMDNTYLLFVVLLFMVPLLAFIVELIAGSKRRRRGAQPKDRRTSGGGTLGRKPSPTQSLTQKEPAQTQDLCEVCGKRPKYVENDGRVHPYCGRTCARASQLPCKYPACRDSGKSAFSGYCGFIHARDAVDHGLTPACTECKSQPQAVGELCLECNNSVGNLTEPRLKEVDPRDPNVISLADHFTRSWRGPDPVKIGRIYEIRLPPNLAEPRDTYNSKLAALGTPRQIQTFHSTQCICDLGTNNARFCSWESCGICAIISTAFTSFEFKIKSNSGQFGDGVYSYLDPSLADQWALSTTSSPYRVMLACEVNLPPPEAKRTRSSGIVRSQETGPLVYVSGPDAITPRYLILYSYPRPKYPATPLNGSQSVVSNRRTSTYQ